MPGSLRLYDTHAHLISDDLVKYPRDLARFTPAGAPPGAPPSGSEATRMGIGPGVIGRPGGMHGPNPINEKPTAEQMHSWMAEENVVGITAVQKGRLYGTDNSYIVDAAELFPDKMRAIIIVDPQEEQTPEMIRALALRGIAGIRFFGTGVADKLAWLGSPQSVKSWALADELGLVVDIEAPGPGAGLLDLITGMADRFPRMSVVLDHLSLPMVSEIDYGIGAQFDAVAARSNIFQKFTSINMDISREQGVRPEEVLRRAVDFYGADKVMWGSDIGTSSGTYKEMVARAIDSTKLLSDNEQRAVLHDTGRRVMLGSKAA